MRGGERHGEEREAARGGRQKGGRVRRVAVCGGLVMNIHSRSHGVLSFTGLALRLRVRGNVQLALALGVSAFGRFGVGACGSAYSRVFIPHRPRGGAVLWLPFWRGRRQGGVRTLAHSFRVRPLRKRENR